MKDFLTKMFQWLSVAVMMTLCDNCNEKENDNEKYHIIKRAWCEHEHK